MAYRQVKPKWSRHCPVISSSTTANLDKIYEFFKVVGSPAAGNCFAH
jgi:hypothetical protein